MKVKELVSYLDYRFPKENAENYDQNKIGFVIGSLDYEITNVLLALDLTKEVVTEAINNNCNMIITHHPFIWDPITKLIIEDNRTQIIKMMLINNISLYSMHTNLDVSDIGVNVSLCKKLNIKNVKSLQEDLSGNYLRFGDVDKMSLKDLCQKVKIAFELNSVRYIGSLDKEITKVGIVGGAGGSIFDINKAIFSGIDCYITGEIKLNCAQYANEKNFAMIEVNHGVERFVFPYLKEEIIKELPNLSGKILISKINTDPLKSI